MSVTEPAILNYSAMTHKLNRNNCTNEYPIKGEMMTSVIFQICVHIYILNTGLLEMTVWVLTTCHTQHT
jgi:hypothetical protein